MTPDDKWVAAFETGVDYEAELVADRLKDSDIPAVVMNQREKSIGIPFTDQKLIQVLVPPDRINEAKAVLAQKPVSDADLEQAALNADPSVAEEYYGDEVDEEPDEE